LQFALQVLAAPSETVAFSHPAILIKEQAESYNCTEDTGGDQEGSEGSVWCFGWLIKQQENTSARSYWEQG